MTQVIHRAGAIRLGIVPARPACRDVPERHVIAMLARELGSAGAGPRRPSVEFVDAIERGRERMRGRTLVRAEIEAAPLGAR
jgi:hypothetical protein